jgi:hypothetical protein
MQPDLPVVQGTPCLLPARTWPQGLLPCRMGRHAAAISTLLHRDNWMQVAQRTLRTAYSALSWAPAACQTGAARQLLAARIKSSSSSSRMAVACRRPQPSACDPAALRLHPAVHRLAVCSMASSPLTQGPWLRLLRPRWRMQAVAARPAVLVASRRNRHSISAHRSDNLPVLWWTRGARRLGSPAASRGVAGTSQPMSCLQKSWRTWATLVRAAHTATEPVTKRT